MQTSFLSLLIPFALVALVIILVIRNRKRESVEKYDSFKQRQLSRTPRMIQNVLAYKEISGFKTIVYGDTNYDVFISENYMLFSHQKNFVFPELRTFPLIALAKELVSIDESVAMVVFKPTDVAYKENSEGKFYIQVTGPNLSEYGTSLHLSIGPIPKEILTHFDCIKTWM